MRGLASPSMIFRVLLIVSVLTPLQAFAMPEHARLDPYWQAHGVFGQFAGENKLSIVYLAAPVESAKATLVLLPGRSEPFLKYIELVKFFHSHGISVFAMDHRGQGLSARILQQSLKGHVEDFAHYSADVQTFVNQIVLP